MTVDHYALRTGGATDYQPLHWELQGAATTDGPWTTLRRHDDDPSFTSEGNYEVAAWPVDGAAPFRAFRIHQHGNNKSGNHWLYLGGIELYGELAYV